MRKFTRGRAGSQWKRGFDWDSTIFPDLVLGPGNTPIYSEWIRVPSDATDPLSPGGTYIIPPKTLVITRCFNAMIMNPSDAAGEAHYGAWGVIAWDGPDGNTPTVGLPNVNNGALDWIMWQPFAAQTTFVGQYFTYSALQGDPMESKAMRKLPPGKGVLFIIEFATANPQLLRANFEFRLGLKGDVTAAGLGGG